MLEDFVKLFTLVTKNAKVAVVDIKKGNSDIRRKALKDGNDEEYKKLVME
jgi:hypothetical protein